MLELWCGIRLRGLLVAVAGKDAQSLYGGGDRGLSSLPISKSLIMIKSTKALITLI